MLNLINAIPENIGWFMVGFISACDIFMISLVIKTIIKARKTITKER